MKSLDDAARRDFLRTAAGVGGGLIIAVTLPAAGRLGAAAAAAKGSGEAEAVNAFVKIDVDGNVTLVMHKSEMGQGVYTGLAQLIAEELDCDLARVRIETAPVAAVYDNPLYHLQFTGGSMSISSCWNGLRLAGATARTMLIGAAAQDWQVSVEACRTERNFVYGPGGRKIGYGRLAAAAAKRAPPDPAAIRLKPPSEFTVIGKPIKRIEVAEKVNGTGMFGLDVRLPGMLRAVIARPPTLGSTAKTIDEGAARAVRGVITVVKLSAGVAVVAQNTYAARKGRDALVIEWQATPGPALDTERMRADYQKVALTEASLIARNDGDAAAAAAWRRLEASRSAVRGAVSRARAHGAAELRRRLARGPLRCVDRNADAIARPCRRRRGGRPASRQGVHSHAVVGRRVRAAGESGERFRA